MTLAIQVWHASLTEMIWTTIGLVGFYFVRKQLVRSTRYIEATRKLNGENLRRASELRILAYGHFRNALFRTAKTLIVILLGFMFMLIPNDPGEPSLTGLIFTGWLFTMELLIIMPGILDDRQAEALEDLDRYNR